MAQEQTILTAMDFLKETFYKYADMDDEKGTMSKKELSDMLKKHMNVVSRNNTQHCSNSDLRMIINCMFFSLH
ncbi:unnamed protein product [Tetraodon nigroviridis]|uniref:(spotted green pufferfish) hypothetical protein n=1 Tax=Tetraodon nigroviridis TaxID=99883 RepID=Q4RIC3_TETNG|nr:unnamed protein product [Tetraodon nigroviridis]